MPLSGCGLCRAFVAGAMSYGNGIIAMMHKKSRARTRHRRAQWRIAVPVVVTCANDACGRRTPPHAACRHCGMYRGRQVMPPE
ncbi:50S ribosomal protein L32 [Streptomyces laurentii]|uniref:50S ribosomal protein L32 n=1 Tax=Streptomyces laurentii TaxID=39478 RepID=UPI00369613AC